MVCELRHENDVVLLLNVNENFRIDEIVGVVDGEKIPLGLAHIKKIDMYDVNDWIVSRGMPVEREGAGYILDKENVNSVHELLIKNKCLGLTDHYWVVEKDSNLDWKDVNYFDNDHLMSKEGDDIYLGVKREYVEEGDTPNCSASGMQPKMWILHNNERWLLKNSEEISKQEPYSELAASLILEKLGIEHVSYELFTKNNDVVSGCPSMLGKNNELVTAWYVCRDKRYNNESNLDHYIRKCRDLGIKGDLRKQLEQMIVVDYVMANIDRHWNNFGIIRNAKTLEGEKLAPLYDHGASFFTKHHHLEMFEKNRDLDCKSFRKKQEENIKFVKDIDWLNRGVLREIPEIVREAVKDNMYGSVERTDVIVSCIKDRILAFQRKFGISVGSRGKVVSGKECEVVNKDDVGIMRYFVLQNKCLNEVMTLAEIKEESKKVLYSDAGDVRKEYVQSRYTNNETGKDVFVLEKLEYTGKDMFLNHVWHVDRKLTEAQIDAFMEKKGVNKNEIHRGKKI